MRLRFPTSGFFTASLVATLGVTGCSLTGVAKFDLGECRTDEDCRDAFNEREGFYPDCAAFICEKGERNACKRVKGEICDGLDNDCDRLVDEPSGDKATLSLLTSDALATSIDGALSASAITSTTFSEIYVQTGEGVVLVESDKGNLGAASLSTIADEGLDNPLELGLVDGCRTEPSGLVRACNETQTRVAAGTNVGFFTAVTTTGCAAGILRVGALDPNTPAELLERGPGFRAPTYRGVSATTAGCSANDRPECQAAAVKHASDATDENALAVVKECGLTAPSIAAFGSRALVTAIGDGAKRSQCGGSVRSLLGLGLYGRAGLFGETFVWADPTSDGKPQKLASTVGGFPAASLPLGDSGFLLAYPNESGAPTLGFVKALANPGSNSGTDCPEGDCESREGLETPDLEPLEVLTTLPISGASDGLTLSLLDVSEKSATERTGYLAVSWIEGCTEVEGSFVSGTVVATVLPATWGASGISLGAPSPSVNLGVTSAPPVVLVSPTGFAASGFERGGKRANDKSTGGFTVIRRTPEGLVAERLLALDGQRVDAKESVKLEGKNLSLLGRTATGASLLLGDTDAGELREAFLGCE